MKLSIIKTLGFTAIIIFLASVTNLFASDNVEWISRMTLQLEAVPNDVAFTQDGSQIFVLTDQGEILIYSSAARLVAKIDVGKHVDKIQVSSKGDVLILNSRKNKTVQVINLVAIQKINVSDSPFKGREDAPIVIVAFDDFQ